MAAGQLPVISPRAHLVWLVVVSHSHWQRHLAPVPPRQMWDVFAVLDLFTVSVRSVTCLIPDLAVMRRNRRQKQNPQVRYGIVRVGRGPDQPSLDNLRKA